MSKDWLNIYKSSLEDRGYKEDQEQLKIIGEFARIESQLKSYVKEEKPKKWSIYKYIKSDDYTKNQIKGLYMYGGVGRGKTFLMDLFCKNTSFEVKRQHFVHFMKYIHDQLKLINDQTYPLDIVTTTIAKEVRILCLDEFIVLDITDAMILDRVLHGLIHKGVIIITTSNIKPDQLYKDGLQRERFLKTIKLINEYLAVCHIANGMDYRRLCLDRFDRFILANDKSYDKLLALVNELSKGSRLEKNGEIEVNLRKINYIAMSLETIWFDFTDICEGNRSQLDYIWIADHFTILILSNVPILGEDKEDAAKRFILLIDELYDRRIRLILS